MAAYFVSQTMNIGNLTNNRDRRSQAKWYQQFDVAITSPNTKSAPIWFIFCP